MTASQLTLPRQVFYDANGQPLAGGLVNTYVPGTTTRVQTYADAAQLTLNSNPITLDANGSCLIYAATGSVSITVTDVAGNAIPAYSGVCYTLGALGEGFNMVGLGADPTGSVDCTGVIEAAIAQLGAAGGRLYFPTGVYKITAGQLQISSPILFIGDGPLNTTFTSNSPTGDYFQITGGGAWFEKLGFTCNVTRTAGNYLTFTGTSNQTGIRDFFMTKQFGGIDFTVGYAGVMQRGNMRYTSGGPGSFNVKINGGNDQYIDHVTMDNDAGNMPTYGIWILDTGCVNLTDVDVIHCNNDLFLNPGAGQAVVAIYAENSYFDTATCGISIQPQAGTNGAVVRCRFTSCWTGSHTGDGVFIDTSGGGNIDGIEFIGHHSFNNTQNNFSINGVNTRNVRIIGGGSANCLAGSGVYVGGNVSYFSITDHFAGSGFGWPSGNGVGIFIAGGSTDHFVVANNTLVGNTTAAITNGATLATHTVVANNLLS